MARVTVTFEDTEFTGGAQIEVTVASDPPLPIARVTDPKWLAEIDGDRDLDLEAATPAQTAARLAVGEVAGMARAATIVVNERNQ